MTFGATVNSIVYEGGIPVFIDTEYDTWNMDPVALEKAFERYPEIRVVVIAHLYGTPGKIDELKEICDRHGAVIVEDATEFFGATYKGVQTGVFGTYNAISFNGNKIITGSSEGMLLTDSREAAEKARKWSTQSRERAAWYQHEELYGLHIYDELNWMTYQSLPQGNIMTNQNVGFAEDYKPIPPVFYENKEE